MSKFQYWPGDFGAIFVPTVETTRLTYFLDSLVANKHHVGGHCFSGLKVLFLRSFGDFGQRDGGCLNKG